MSRFIFMLTQNDLTVANARAVVEEVRDLDIPFIGFKDLGLPLSELQALAADIHASGRTAVLEVVSQTRDDELRSVRSALEIGVGYLLGGTHSDDAARILAGSGITYMPFPGAVAGHPTQLTGTIEDIVASSRRLSRQDGVHGLDLLAYRFGGDVEALISAVVSSVDIPVIAAGSISSVERISKVCKLGVWGFTVGSAVFEGAFPGDTSVSGQIESILRAARTTDTARAI